MFFEVEDKIGHAQALRDVGISYRKDEYFAGALEKFKESKKEFKKVNPNSFRDPTLNDFRRLAILSNAPSISCPCLKVYN